MMIAIAIIVGLSAVVIAGLCLYWNKVVAWIKKAAAKVQQVLGVVVEGTRTFICRTVEGFKNKSKYYYKNKVTREWEEVEYTRIVDESEVPPNILNKVRNKALGEDVSTTEELQLEINA